MKQIKIVNSYLVSDELTKTEGLTVNGKWVLYKLRKDLQPYFDFYRNESTELFNKYETIQNGNSFTFKSPELAQEYKIKQDEIDNLNVEVTFTKQECKLSDIPNITVQQIEALEDFIDFIPE